MHNSFQTDFFISYNETHWSNEAETLRLLDDVIKPYIENARSELDLPAQKALLIWGVFKAQSMDTVKQRMSTIGVERVQVPKNLTRLLHPLVLTTNGSVKIDGKESFCGYYSSTCISKALIAEPDRDPAYSITVDIKLSTLKPRRANVMNKVYQHLKTEKGKSIIKIGFRADGITDSFSGSHWEHANA